MKINNPNSFHRLKTYLNSMLEKEKIEDPDNIMYVNQELIKLNQTKNMDDLDKWMMSYWDADIEFIQRMKNIANS